MMFDDRSSKIEKEHAKIRANAKAKRELEQRLKLQQVAREKELDEIAERRKVEKELSDQLKAQEEENERRLTGGIVFNHVLQPYLIDGEDDKIILPESCLGDLSQQDAFGKGPITFQISSSLVGKLTHCGVREFVAPEGSVGLPQKVIDSLIMDKELGIDTQLLGKISVKFVKMSKCTYVKLQPKLNKFFDVGPVKQCLEENLRFHSTLTVGDQLTVWYRGVAHALIVVEMRPEPQGNLFDTDVEVNLDLSEEHTERLKSVQNTSVTDSPIIASTNSHSAFPATQPRMLNERSVVDSPVTNSTTAANGNTTGDNLSTNHDYAKKLLAEPPTSSGGVIRIKIRLSNGKTVVRSFEITTPLSQLFYFVGVEMQLKESELYQVQFMSKATNNNYRLVEEDMDKSFQDVGLTDSNIMLMMSMT